MGSKVSKYRLLKDDEKSIELEDYPLRPKNSLTIPELISQCQKLIVLGFPLEAFALIEENSLSHPSLYLPLHTQHFIELISRKNFLEALQFAQKHLSMHKEKSFTLEKSNEKLQISVTDIMGLLCYENPDQSILSYMLEPSIRVLFADYTAKILTPPVSQRKICDLFKCCKKKKN